jgi:hypothetical protein
MFGARHGEGEVAAWAFVLGGELGLLGLLAADFGGFLSNSEPRMGCGWWAGEVLGDVVMGISSPLQSIMVRPP